MTPEVTIAVDYHACDLCPRYRPKEPRAMGIDWVDCYWACEECCSMYRRSLLVAGRKKVRHG
jgi:hypothetical protein